MLGIMYAKVLACQNNLYGEQNMIMKKIAKWSMLVPIKIVEWITWPVAKVHAWLYKLADWLTMKL